MVIQWTCVYTAHIYPCMDVHWTTLLCPQTHGSKLDVKRMSIRCTVLFGMIFTSFIKRDCPFRRGPITFILAMILKNTIL